MPARPARNHPLDAHLVASGRGDAQAFEEVYEAMAPRVYGLVLRLLVDVHQAEEVTQEVFLEAWQRAGRFDPARGSASSWLLSLAHHKAVDRVRATDASRRRDHTHAERTVRAPYDETAADAHAALDAATIRTALAALSPGQRQALELAYFGGHTYNEVSRLLQIPLGTAKSRIRDGLLRLRDLLAPLAVEPA